MKCLSLSLALLLALVAPAAAEETAPAHDPRQAHAETDTNGDGSVDRAEFHARIQVREHQLLPQVIHQIAIGAIELDPLRVHTPFGDPSRSLTAPDL